MRAVLLVSIVLGLLWNAIAVVLMGGKPADALRPSWLVAGAVAGMVAGGFTVWSRKRRDGEESIPLGVATFYLGMIVYWATFVIVERAAMCIRHGGWTDFDLHDHLIMILWFLVYGTLWYGILLIPLCFLTRLVIWRVHQRFSG
jgi:mannose/fructose/N-acetylgalactosamine-specific phosphotransferase system component IIC